MAGTYQVQSNGSAPKGLKAGDKVVTAGGTYTIKSVNADGSYNSSKTSDVSTKTYTGTYSTTGSSSSKTTASQAAVNAANQAAQAKKSSSSKTSNRPVTTVSSNPNSTGYSASQAAVNAANTAAKAKGATTNTSTPAMNWTVNSKPATTQATQVQTPSAGYVAQGDYEDADIRNAFPEAAREIDAAKAEFAKAQAANDIKGMQDAHARAEIARAYYGSKLGIGAYSGGIDGSQRISTPQDTPADQWNMAFDKATQDSNYIDGVYVHPADQSILSAKDLQIAVALKKEWPNASPDRRKEINQEMESIRAKYGYSLGPEGDKFKAIQLEPDMMPQIGLPSYEAQPELVNNVYDTLNESTLQQLLAAYNNSRAQSEYDMSKIPAMYQQQKNLVSADNEREKMAFREQAAASGMNAGNRSQAALAYSNQLQNNLGSLNTAEANALSDAQFALTQLYNSYQQQIASAVAQNNYQRAAALLQEYMTAKQSAVETALNQANLDVQIADFNRQTRLNTLQQQNLMRQLELDQRNADRNYSLDLANSAANNIGAYGPLANLSGLSPADAQKLRQMYSVEKLSTDYPLVRGWLV